MDGRKACPIHSASKRHFVACWLSPIKVTSSSINISRLTALAAVLAAYLDFMIT